MTNTVNNLIPFVPENTTDPAAGLNLSLYIIDMLLNISVETVGDNTPPSSPSDGVRYIVGTSPTGAWSGYAHKLAMYKSVTSSWVFRDVSMCFNKATGSLWVYSTSWAEYATTPAAIGEINTASNIGAGTGVFKQKSGVDLQFKSLTAGSNLSLDNTTEPNEIKIETDCIATASNAGTGAGIVYQKTGSDLELKSLKAGTNITLDTATAGEILISASGDAIINYAQSALSADVTMTTAGTWYDGPSIALAAGTWLINAATLITRATGTAAFGYARVTNGTNHYASGVSYVSSVTNEAISVTLSVIVTLTAETVIKTQCTGSATTMLIKAAMPVNGSGNNATIINAIKIA